MQLTLRPYATAGVVIAGAGMIAVPPATAPISASRVADIALTAADIDLVTPFLNQLQTASDNGNELAQNFFIAPFPAMQQAIVNLADHLQDLINGTSFDDVLTDIGTNLKTVLSSFLLAGASDDTVTLALEQTLDSAHNTLFSSLSDQASDSVAQLLGFAASPVSGILLGMVGPMVSPLIATVNSIETIVNDLTGSAADPEAALQALAAAPADIIGSIFNGADLNLDALVPALTDDGILPSGTDGLNLAFGGLLSAGSVQGSTGFADLNTGGSLFNALGLDGTSTPIDGEAVGPLGAMEGLAILAASELGWQSTGSGKGGPPTATDPLTGLHFPTLPTGDESGSTAALADVVNGVPGSDSFDDMINELTNAVSAFF